MKIRTLSQLGDLVDEELAWRKKELWDYKLEVQKRAGPAKNMMLRAGVPLIYAHWEGLVKSVCEHYLTYVGVLRLSHDELNDEFLALCLRSALTEARETSNPEPAKDAVRRIRVGTERAKFPIASVVRT